MKMMITNLLCLTVFGLTVLMTFSPSLAAKSVVKLNRKIKTFADIRKMKLVVKANAVILKVTFKEHTSTAITCRDYLGNDYIEHSPSVITKPKKGVRVATCTGRVTANPNDTIEFSIEDRNKQRTIGIAIRKALAKKKYTVANVFIPHIEPLRKSEFIYNNGENINLQVRYRMSGEGPVDPSKIQFKITTVLFNGDTGDVKISEKYKPLKFNVENPKCKFRKVEIKLETAISSDSGFMDMQTKYEWPKSSIVHTTSAMETITFVSSKEVEYFPENFIGFINLNVADKKSQTISVQCRHNIRCGFICIGIGEYIKAMSVTKTEADGTVTSVVDVTKKDMARYFQVLTVNVAYPPDFVGTLQYECHIQNSAERNKTQNYNVLIS